MGFLDKVLGRRSTTDDAPEGHNLGDEREEYDENLPQRYHDYVEQSVYTEDGPEVEGSPEQMAEEPSADSSQQTKSNDPSKAVLAWLERLGEERPENCDRLTDELLEAVGNPPVPSKYGSPSTRNLLDYYSARSFGSQMAAKYSRKAYLDLGAAEKANDPAGMERADNRAKFWAYVSRWFEQTYN
jgi:hypothetical protein